MNQEPYTPKHLNLWKYPSYYLEETWGGYYVFLGRYQDSDCLANSNFECALEKIGGKSEENGVYVVREGHWTCGWVEWIAIHQDNYEALRIADKVIEKLEDYPVLDEYDLSNRETEMTSDPS
jgi:hypothetical protein